MVIRHSFRCKPFGTCPFPDNLCAEIVRSKYLIQHYFDVVAGVPVAVVVEAAGGLEYPVQFRYARTHVADISHSIAVAVVEGTLFLVVAPKHFVVAVGVEGRVNIDQVNCLGWEMLKYFQAVPAIHRLWRKDYRLHSSGARGHGNDFSSNRCRFNLTNVHYSHVLQVRIQVRAYRTR